MESIWPEGHPMNNCGRISGEAAYTIDLGRVTRGTVGTVNDKVGHPGLAVRIWESPDTQPDSSLDMIVVKPEREVLTPSEMNRALNKALGTDCDRTPDEIDLAILDLLENSDLMDAMQEVASQPRHFD